MHEVELRVILNQTQYENVFVYLKNNSCFLNNEKQITYYFDTPVDTRIQITNDYSRFWQKKGKMHDEIRQEYEIMLQKKDAKTVINIFENLGFSIKVAWYRERSSFKYNDINIALDNTIGYGQILEVEIIDDGLNFELAKEKLLKFLNQLNFEPTPKSIFNEMFNDYLNNWKMITKELSVDWLEKK